MKRYDLYEKWPCECGREHEFGIYIAAHWDEALVHTCEHCQRQHKIQRGHVTLLPKKRKVKP